MKNKFIQENTNSSEEGFEKGIVTEKVDENSVKIELESKEACEHCHAKVICQPDEDGKRQVVLKNTLNAQVEDRVLLESSDLLHIQVTAMQYGLPLLGFLLGLFISNSIIKSSLFSMPKELVSFLTGVLGISLASLITYLWSRKKRKDNFSVLEMKSIVQDDE